MLVEDMFYNVPARQKAIRSASEEHARILDMVGRYAVLATAVGITVKRHGEARPDLHTTAGAGQLDAIRRAAGACSGGWPLAASQLNARYACQCSGDLDILNVGRCLQSCLWIVRLEAPARLRADRGSRRIPAAIRCQPRLGKLHCPGVSGHSDSP